MKRAYFVCLFLCLATALLFSQSRPVPLARPSAGPASSATAADPKAQARIVESYGKLPLSFQANRGQTDPSVRFLSRTGAYSLFLTGDEAVFTLRGSAAKKRSPQRLKPASLVGSDGTAEAVPFPGILRGVSSIKGGGKGGHKTDVLGMKLRNANPAAKVTGVDELPGTSNYFIGNDPAKWRTNVPTYAKVKYEGIYPGIDLVYYGNQRQLEYDFIVAPGADPRRIGFDVRGATRIRADAQGDLVLQISEGEVRWHKPIVYQEKYGKRRAVPAHYIVSDTNRVRFEIANYDTSVALYIDPLLYSTYLGGSGGSFGNSVAVDGAGNAYLTGVAPSADFPTMGSLQGYGGGGDVFVTKLDSAGAALVYSTFLGGSGEDWGYGIALDKDGYAYVTGWTQSTDFPTKNALQATYGGYRDAFAAKIVPSGSALVYSTYLGGFGQDVGNGIAVDTSGNAYVTGYTQSNNFPTMNALQPIYGGDQDAFVTAINSAGSAYLYSTYLGGSRSDSGNAIAVDSAANAYVTGETESINFPATNLLQACDKGGSFNAFVTKFNPSGSAQVYSTCFGGSGISGGYGIALDSANNAFITGLTLSSDFPVTPGAYQTTCGGDNGCGYSDAFVTKLNSTGSGLIYSTYLGGNSYDYGYGITVDSSGNAYVAGQTESTDFPTTSNSFQKGCGGGQSYPCFDAFMSKINPAGTALIYSTYLGGSGNDAGAGISVDSSGNAIIIGWTSSVDFPITPGAFQTQCKDFQCSFGDTFVAKFGTLAPTVTGIVSSSNPSTFGQSVTFTATVTSQGTGTPTGTVTFFDGSANLGNTQLNGKGIATLTNSTLEGGTHSITASYSGDSNFAPSTSSVLSQVVTPLPTQGKLSSYPNASRYGEYVRLTAVLFQGGEIEPTGTVDYYDGGNYIGSSEMMGQETYQFVEFTTVGQHPLTAYYTGDDNYGPCTTPVWIQTVAKASVSISLSSSSNPSNVNQSVTYTAVVSAAPSVPTGSVTFKEGSKTLGTVALSNGQASFTTSFAKAGTFSVVGIYSGDQDYLPKNSKAVKQVVEKYVTTTALNSSPNPSAQGQAVTFKATVSSGGPKPTGKVVFKNGSASLGSKTLVNGVATLTTSKLPVGSLSITATYDGDAASDTSTSPLLTQVVN